MNWCTPKKNCEKRFIAINGKSFCVKENGTDVERIARIRRLFNLLNGDAL
jgi:hypothetical protein